MEKPISVLSIAQLTAQILNDEEPTTQRSAARQLACLVSSNQQPSPVLLNSIPTILHKLRPKLVELLCRKDDEEIQVFAVTILMRCTSWCSDDPDHEMVTSLLDEYQRDTLGALAIEYLPQMIAVYLRNLGSSDDNGDRCKSIIAMHENPALQAIIMRVILLTGHDHQQWAWEIFREHFDEQFSSSTPDCRVLIVSAVGLLTDIELEDRFTYVLARLNQTILDNGSEASEFATEVAGDRNPNNWLLHPRIGLEELDATVVE